ncbi:ABC transporter transmembrane domain-containing protein, partial [Candidatus Margulisiibacteriota bacterium]
MEKLIKVFEEKGEKLVISSNDPFVLDDSKYVYFILDKNIEIFSIKLEDNQPAGRRTHFFTAGPGSVLFGMDIDKFSQSQRGLLAVPNLNTTLIRISLRKFQWMLKNSGYRDGLCFLIDRWIWNLSSGIRKSIENTPDSAFLLDNYAEEIMLVNGENVSVKKGVLWLSMKEGQLVYLGMEDIVSTDKKYWFPLTDNTWIQVIKHTEVRTLPTIDAIELGNFWKNLDSFYHLLFVCEDWNKNFVAVDELNLLKERINIDEASYRYALRNLTVFETGFSLETELKTHNTVIDVCRIMGNYLNVPIKLPISTKTSSAKLDLHDIAKASGIRVRMISLDGNWWQNDTGPYMAFLKENNRPVALIPMSSKSYTMFDTVQDRKYILNEDIAAKITRFAYTLYRPFTGNILFGKDIIKFSIKSNKRDIFVLGLSAVLGGLIGLFPFIAIKILFNNIVPGAEKFQLLQLFVGFILCAGANLLFDIAKNNAVLRIVQKVDVTLGAALWDRMLRLPVSFFRKYLVGDLTLRALGIHSIRKILTDKSIFSFLKLI